MLKYLSNEEFAEIIENSKGDGVVDFFAEWCGPCKMMSPLVDEFAEKYPDINFYKVDVDECMETARKYGIMSVPTFILFKDGQPVKKQLGVMSEDEFTSFIN